MINDNNKISAEDIDFDEKKWDALVNFDDILSESSAQPIGSSNVNFCKKDIVKLSVNNLNISTFLNSNTFIHTGRSMKILIQPSSHQRVRYENECKTILRYISVPNKRTMTIEIPDLRHMLMINESFWIRITRTTVNHLKDNLIFYHPYPMWIKDKDAKIHNGSMFVQISDQDMNNGFIEIDTLALIRLKQDDLAKIDTLAVYSRNQLYPCQLQSICIATPKYIRDEYKLRESILNFQLVRLDSNNVAYPTDCCCQTESIYEIEANGERRIAKSKTKHKTRSKIYKKIINK